MKRVLQVVSCLSKGGTEAFIMNNYRQLDTSICQFDFIVFEDGWNDYVDEIEQRGGRVFFVGPPSKLRICRFLSRVLTIMSTKGPYAAVHSHVNIQNGWVLLAAKQAGIPVRISHSHDTGIPVREPLPVKLLRMFERRLIIQNATILAACSFAAGRYLYGGVPVEKVAVVPNGIMLEPFLSNDFDSTIRLREELRIDASQLVLGNISRFEAKKNTLFTIYVFSELQKIAPSSVLVLGGDDGGQLAEAQALVEQLGIASKVRFIGRRNDVPACLKVMDIYLFPSLHEGLPIAFLEAQAAGCLCIASEAVTNEVDMDIGSAHFLSLDLGAKEWARIILESFATWERPCEKLIRGCFEKKNFEISLAHRRLLELYGLTTGISAGDSHRSNCGFLEKS